MEELEPKEPIFKLGAYKDKYDRRDYRISGILPISEEVTIPSSFVVIDNFPVKNQSTRPSCTSHAQAHHKERQEVVELSPRFIMALTKQLEANKNEGAYTRNTFKVVQDRGACETTVLQEPDSNMSWEEYIDVAKIPTNTYANASLHRSKTFWRVNKNLDEIKQVLVQYGNSIVCSMDWKKEFNTPMNGLLPFIYGQSVGGHAVDLIGYNDIEQILIFKNSWGEYWGDKGRFYMPYSIMNDVTWDFWVSLDLPIDPPVLKRYGQERTWLKFLEEQKLAFNPWLINKIKRLPSPMEINGSVYGFHDFSTVFKGINGDVWLNKTKPQLIKEGFDYKV